MRSDFGASFLVKLRSQLRELPQAQWPVRRERPVDSLVRHAEPRMPPDQLTLYQDVDMAQPRAETRAPTDEAQAR